MRLPSAAAAATILAAVAALLPATPAAAAGDPIMPLSQVHAGMRCTGYSVVQGTTISSFDVEVLDVVAGDPSEDGPRILVQVSGPAVDSTGIGPGFSGSPIYCPDAAGTQRNIGAISEGIGEFGNKVVLATPIEAMLAAKPDAPRARSGATRRAAARSRAATARAATARGALPARLVRLRSRAERTLRRHGSIDLTGPLTVSGVSPELGRALEAAGQRVGRPLEAAPAGPLGSFPPQTLRPGSAVAVGYSGGDLRLGAIGTVAYTDGDAVWAFGHPFEGAGARSLLLQDAYVFHVVNDPNPDDESGSYKLSAAGHDLGTLSDDALDAVVGRVGAPPPTIPIRVRAHDDDTGKVAALHVTAADETDVGMPTGTSALSLVAPIAVLQAGTTALGAAPGRLTGRMCMTVVLREGNRRARFCHRYVSGSGGGSFGIDDPIADQMANDVANALALIDSYEGRPPHVRRVNVTLHVERGEHRADMIGLRAPPDVHRGRRVRLRLALQRVRGGRSTRTVTVRLPRHLATGRRPLTLRGGANAGGLSTSDILDLIVGGGGTNSGPNTLGGLVSSIDATGGYDGVTGHLAGQSFRVLRDPNLLITGSVTTPVVVRR